jgi:predicted dehydrogenase
VINGAFVGFGVVASNGHWPAYANRGDARIVAVVDPLPDRRALAETTIPGVLTFERIEQLPGHIHFIDVCTPPALHVDAILAGLDRHCHVLCEKPLVLQREAIHAIRSRAVAHDLAVVPAHNWKYAPILRRATELLRAGAIGSLERVEIVTTRTQAAVPVGGSARNWRVDPAMAGGGILMDHGWHAIYLALHWFAEAPIGLEADLKRPNAGGVEDEAALTIHFPSGSAHIELSWRGKSRRNSATLTGTAGRIDAADDTLHLSGTAARIEPMAAALSAGSHHADWFTAMLPDVIACFRAPSTSRPLFEEAAQCLSIIQKAYATDNSQLAIQTTPESL